MVFIVFRDLFLQIYKCCHPFLCHSAVCVSVFFSLCFRSLLDTQKIPDFCASIFFSVPHRFRCCECHCCWFCRCREPYLKAFVPLVELQHADFGRFKEFLWLGNTHKNTHTCLPASLVTCHAYTNKCQTTIVARFIRKIQSCDKMKTTV